MKSMRRMVRNESSEQPKTDNWNDNDAMRYSAVSSQKYRGL